MDTASRTQTCLREFLDARLVRYTSVARQLGISPSHLHQLMEGTRPITEPMAERLAELFSVPAETFLPSTDGKDGAA